MMKLWHCILLEYLGFSLMVFPYVMCRGSTIKRLVDHERQVTYEEAQTICKDHGQSLPTVDDLQEIAESTHNISEIWILPNEIPSKITRECRKDYFICDKDRCMNPALLCDGVGHCLDGSDENDCKYNHIKNGFELFENNWLKTFAQEMGVIAAAQLCADNEAEFWIPRSTAENEYIHNVISMNSLQYMWYPFNDTETEGVFRYSNGNEISSADVIPWDGYDNDVASDCAQMNNEGKVKIYSCNVKNAGVVCRSKF